MINSGFLSLLMMMHTDQSLPSKIVSSSSSEPHSSGTHSLCILRRNSQPVRRKEGETAVALSSWANCSTTLTMFVTNSVCTVNVVPIMFIAIFFPPWSTRLILSMSELPLKPKLSYAQRTAATHCEAVPKLLKVANHAITCFSDLGRRDPQDSSGSQPRTCANSSAHLRP